MVCYYLSFSLTDSMGCMNRINFFSFEKFLANSCNLSHKDHHISYTQNLAINNILYLLKPSDIFNDLNRYNSSILWFDLLHIHHLRVNSTNFYPFQRKTHD